MMVIMVVVTVMMAVTIMIMVNSGMAHQSAV